MARVQKDFEVKGLAELQKALDTLPQKLANNVMRGALLAGAKVVAEQARANVNSNTGELAKAIRAGSRLDRKSKQPMGYVRVGGGKDGKGWYAHLVEFGTAPHIIKIDPDKVQGNVPSVRALNKALGSLKIGGSLVGVQVEHPGAQAKPFMRPALDQAGPAALQAVQDYVRRRLATKHGINVPDPAASAATDES